MNKITERTGATAEAIISHYDMGNDFFKLVLGPELVYSCALFSETEDLDSAQQRKLDYHIDAAGAGGKARVLDVGCGWGTMLNRLVGTANVANAVGITLSPSQASHIRAQANTKIQVIVEDWRDHFPIKKYDSVVSIGAFEHFVQKGLDPAQKQKTYREFFKFCDRVLVPGGKLSLQTIAYTEPYELHPVLERTFPESDLPLTWEPLAASERWFQLVAMRNDPDHYYRTLKFWESNLERRYFEAVNLVGEQAASDFRRYLQISAMGFNSGIIGLLRMSFVKRAILSDAPEFPASA